MILVCAYKPLRSQILLTCGCQPWVQGALPEIGEAVLCIAHNHKRQYRVLNVHWRVRCEDCTYSRANLGCSKLTAEGLAARHALKQRHAGPHHRVRVWCEYKGVVTQERMIGPEAPGQTSIDDLPPF